jgi:FAD/FMN-containing dehydrogenase
VWLPYESGEHAAAETAWARRFHKALQPQSAGSVYVNFLDSDDDATAYAARDVAHNIIIDAVWLPDESDENAAAETAWARRFLQALQPHRAGGVYVNFLDSDDGSSRVREAYGDQIYRRLAEVKAKYDPDNAFHHNKNIQPG